MANYPTTSYTNLEERFKSIAGLQSLETTDSAFLRQAVNRRIRTAYERYPWPEFTIIGEKVTLSGVTYNDADPPVVTSLGNDGLIQTYNVNGFADPTSQNANPKPLANDANVIFRIHSSDPTSVFYPEELTFISLVSDVVGSGSTISVPCVKIISSGGPYVGDVWVTYRKDLMSVIKEPTSDGSGGISDTYTSGFIGKESTDNPNVPYTFFEYAAFGAYADFLRGDGQTDKAQVEDQNAELILISEIDKVRNQSRQFRHDVLQYRPQTQFRRHNIQAGGSPINTAGTLLNNNVQ